MVTKLNEIEHLLRPRYEVQVKYPNSRYKVKDVIDLYFKDSKGKYHTYTYIGGNKQYENYFDEYPDVFKKLTWWERRPVNVLPKYIRVDRLNKSEYIEVEEWRIHEQMDFPCYKYNGIWNIPTRIIIPLVEEEYEKFLSKI